VRYLSVCSGIEAATVAWHPLGWTPVAFAEIEKFPCAVLAHHYPNVPNWGDMTKFQEWPDANIDVLVGGTPCQSFSVAGLRRGLADPRGNLMLTYLAILDKYRPTWMAWENVPGVRSSNKGRDFGSFLGGLGELGYGWAYRSLDAQYFHLAQRRERVFVVGCLRGWERAAQVLFEFESLSGNPAPSRETREGFTYDVAPCLAASGRGFERPGDSRGQDCLVAFGGNNTSGPIDVATAVNACASEGVGVLREALSKIQEVWRSTYGKGEASTSWAVRRLTPKEAARLQGFQDDYLDITYRGKPAADGNKYKALGNSFAVPVVRWLGERIQMVEEMQWK
jgi:DNA (cytosine-5)-methyltransferase 1